MCLSRIASAVQPSVGAMLDCTNGPRFTLRRNGVQNEVHGTSLCRTSGFDSTSRTTNKNGHRKGARLIWWRRRESNPRPQALYSQFYILSQVI